MDRLTTCAAAMAHPPSPLPPSPYTHCSPGSSNRDSSSYHFHRLSFCFPIKVTEKERDDTSCLAKLWKHLLRELRSYHYSLFKPQEDQTNDFFPILTWILFLWFRVMFPITCTATAISSLQCLTLPCLTLFCMNKSIWTDGMKVLVMWLLHLSWIDTGMTVSGAF